ncbi:hypothetical protein [Streptomyces sp. NBC_00996]|nr:hypothetical protein OG390_04140 [Streptomyces sp. NBC_00996]
MHGLRTVTLPHTPAQLVPDSTSRLPGLSPAADARLSQKEYE